MMMETYTPKRRKSKLNPKRIVDVLLWEVYDELCNRGFIVTRSYFMTKYCLVNKTLFYHPVSQKTLQNLWQSLVEHKQHDLAIKVHNRLMGVK